MTAGRQLLWFAASLAVTACVVMLWQMIADARLVSPVFLPGPNRAWAALVDGFSRGDLLHKLAGTVERMIYGWLLASLLGIALGAVIGMSKAAQLYLTPMLELIRPLPASAIIPVAISFFGLSDGMVLVVIGFGALWPMLLSTIHGFAAVEPRLYEVSRMLGLSRLEVVRKIALPSAMPDILAGARVGITIALILAVVGEMLASREGLGQWILVSARSFRSADVFAGVMLLGAVGLVSGGLLASLERRLLQWRTRG
jgi:sulfonate transport system permease protein